MRPLLLLFATIAPAADLVIRDITYIDVTGAMPPARASLWLEGRRVRAIGARLQIPPSAEVIEGKGKYLIPALCDAHFHLIRDPSGATSTLSKLLAHGITTVRDMGSDPQRIVALRDAIASGRTAGPRLFVAGPMIDGPPAKPDVTMHIVSDARQASAEVEQLAALGVDFIKVQQNLTGEAWLAVIAKAREKRLPVMGHTPDAITPAQLARQGQRTIEHLTGILTACSTEEPALRAIIAKGVPAVDFGPLGPAGRIALDSYSEQKASTLFRQLAGVFHVPTLVWEKAYLLARSSRRSPEIAAMMRESYARGLQLVRAMHSAGLVFAAGTDGGKQARQGPKRRNHPRQKFTVRHLRTECLGKPDESKVCGACYD